MDPLLFCYQSHLNESTGSKWLITLNHDQEKSDFIKIKSDYNLGRKSDQKHRRVAKINVRRTELYAEFISIRVVNIGQNLIENR